MSQSAKQTIITKDTLVPLALVIALAGWAYSLGAQAQKIENVVQNMADVKSEVSALSGKLNDFMLSRPAQVSKVTSTP